MTPGLIELHAMPAIAGLETPRDFYQVITQPAPLAGMPYPDERTPWREFARLGFRKVICLAREHPEYDPAPLRILKALELQDLFGGRSPADPAREQALAAEAVAAGLEWLRAGQGVIVHCAGGTGRSGTVIGGMLCALGLPSEQVIAYLERLTQARRGYSWPESPWQAEQVRRFTE
jgi:hypothetical protein